MPRPPRPPSYPKKPHKSGLARVKIHGRDVYLGPFGSQESYTAFRKLVDDWHTGQKRAAAVPMPAQSPLKVKTVHDLVAEFLVWAKVKYRKKDGAPKPELRNFPPALKPVTDLHGDLPAKDFRVGQLEEVQEDMVRRGWKPAVINRNIVRIRTCWRWAERKDLVPEGRWNNLRALPGLEAGEPDVPPVPEEDLVATLPHLGRIPRAMVEIQLLTAGRPSEIEGLRPRDFQRTGKFQLHAGESLHLGGVWAVELLEHKTAHKKQRRFLLFGPQAQAVLQPFLEGRDPDAYLFSPKDAAIEFLEATERRIHHDRKRAPGEKYERFSYRNAVRRACDRAFPPPAPLAKREDESWRAWKQRLTAGQRLELKAWRKAHRWHPYQLRHNAATRLVKQFGWDVARIVLGHKTVKMTRIYAKDDVLKAASAIEKAG